MVTCRTHVKQAILAELALIALIAVPAVARAEKERMACYEGTAVPAGGTALADAVKAAKEGALLCLEPGEHAGGIALDRSITLVGAEGAAHTTIKGSGRGPVVSINEDGQSIYIGGVTLTGGSAEEGAGVSVRAYGEVTITGCVFRANHAGGYGGGGLYARGGRLVVRDTTFEANTGNQGGAVLLDQAMKAEFTGCRFVMNEGHLGGALRVREGVEGTFKKCVFRGNKSPEGSVLNVTASSTRSPVLVIDTCDVQDGTIWNSGTHRGKVTVKGSKLPAAAKGAEGLTDGGGNTYGKE